MANEKKFYCLCEHNCKFETMTKEQILAAIAQAVEAGAIGDVDTGFVSRVVEQNKQGTLYFWVGTQAEYNALETVASDCHYFITDDSTKADIYATIAQFADYLKAVEEKTNSFGAVLFEDLENGVAAGETIEFNASSYNCFMVTLGDDSPEEINIYCTKSSSGGFYICGTHSIMSYMDMGGEIAPLLIAYRVSIEVDEFSNTHKVYLAQYDGDLTFKTPKEGIKVKRVVGLM
jgi:hypothetical protein